MKRKLDVIKKREIGDNIRQCLIENQLERNTGGDREVICTAKMLANRIGVTPQVIYRLHSGEFSLKLLSMVEIVLGKSFADSTAIKVDGIIEGKPSGNIGEQSWIGAMPVRFGGYSKEAFIHILDGS